MKIKIHLALLIFSSVFGYLEWGGNNSVFLYEAEYSIIEQLFKNTKEALHPFIIIPLVGQVLLIILLFRKKPSKKLIYSSIVCLALLLGFMFIIGLLSLNFKIILSVIPFWVVTVFTIVTLRKNESNRL